MSKKESFVLKRPSLEDTCIIDSMKTLGLFFLFLVIGTGVTFFFLTSNTKKEIAKPKRTLPVQTSKFSLESAPSQSIRGNISSISGEVRWLSRTATESAPITTPQKIQQGELLHTGDNGTVTIIFPNLSIQQAINTELEFMQALPVDFVVSQTTGSADYSNQSTTTPLSIRSMHLLIRLGLGKLSVTVDDEDGEVIVDTLQGAITLAFNDNDNVTQTFTIPENQRLTFDDERRTLTKKSLTR